MHQTVETEGTCYGKANIRFMLYSLLIDNVSHFRTIGKKPLNQNQLISFQNSCLDRIKGIEKKRNKLC